MLRSFHSQEYYNCQHSYCSCPDLCPGQTTIRGIWVPWREEEACQKHLCCTWIWAFCRWFCWTPASKPDSKLTRNHRRALKTLDPLRGADNSCIAGYRGASSLMVFCLSSTADWKVRLRLGCVAHSRHFPSAPLPLIDSVSVMWHVSLCRARRRNEPRTLPPALSD